MLCFSSAWWTCSKVGCHVCVLRSVPPCGTPPFRASFRRVLADHRSKARTAAGDTPIRARFGSREDSEARNLFLRMRLAAERRSKHGEADEGSTRRRRSVHRSSRPASGTAVRRQPPQDAVSGFDVWSDGSAATSQAGSRRSGEITPAARFLRIRFFIRPPALTPAGAIDRVRSSRRG